MNKGHTISHKNDIQSALALLRCEIDIKLNTPNSFAMKCLVAEVLVVPNDDVRSYRLPRLSKARFLTLIDVRYCWLVYGI